MAFVATACGDPAGSARRTHGGASVVGVDPVAAVHLFENHSSSLIAWRRAGVEGRILVHVDGHSDIDWLPDETVAHVAAAKPSELQDLELHPYAIDGSTLRKFAIWNFVYPAVRLGIVREVIWIVPDGSLREPSAAGELVRDLLVGKLHGVSVDEARAIRLDGRVVRGRVAGVPLTICELADFASPSEPVLLDVDLDYFTTRSAVTQQVTVAPWIGPHAFAAALGRKGLRTDLATLSLSTMGGYLPPANRWIGPALQAALRSPGEGAPLESLRLASGAGSSGDLARDLALRRRVVESAPDASAHYALAVALRESGREAEAAAESALAVAADPVLDHAELFEADALWMNGVHAAALERYRAYLATHARSPFATYALRREAGCLMRLNRDEEAIPVFRRVVALAPEHGDSRLDLAVLLRQRGSLDEAVEHLRAARSALPELGTYAMALGTTYLHMGRLDEGIAELETAVARRPTWAQAQASLAAALYDAGRLDEAATHLEVALLLQPGNRQFLQLQARLRSRGALH